MLDAFPRFGERIPEVSVQEMVAQLVPPREFESASLETYEPDTRFPSQAEAVHACMKFATLAPRKRGEGQGLYLDGGFGVGKTHLLVGIFRAFSGPKVFGSFLAFTSLIGALGFAKSLEVLKKFSLICIDEFELDDPGNTMIMSRLMSELPKSTAFAVTSNTPPNALGEGRFAADGFRREILGIGERFAIVRVDGEDYRHRSYNQEHRVFSEKQLTDWLSETNSGGYQIGFTDLLKILAGVHPSRFEQMLKGAARIAIRDAFELKDEFDALRFVAFVDRAYEQQVQLRATKTALPDCFSPRMVSGAYAKKYSRAISRLGALAS